MALVVKGVLAVAPGRLDLCSAGIPEMVVSDLEMEIETEYGGICKCPKSDI